MPNHPYCDKSGRIKYHRILAEKQQNIKSEYLDANGFLLPEIDVHHKDLNKKIFEAGEKTHERVWELPLYDEYDKLMKSDIADIKNTGPSRQAGTIMGGIFLKKFVQNKYPWAHLDIASVAFNLGESTEEYHTQGATGFGVRLFVELLKHYSH